MHDAKFLLRNPNFSTPSTIRGSIHNLFAAHKIDAKQLIDDRFSDRSFRIWRQQALENNALSPRYVQDTDEYMKRRLFDEIKDVYSYRPQTAAIHKKNIFLIVLFFSAIFFLSFFTSNEKIYVGGDGADDISSTIEDDFEFMV